MEFENTIELFDVVSEIGTDGVAGLVPVDRGTIDSVTQGDDDPRFATFVIESGWSKSRRFWGAELFQDVAEQINRHEEPIVGYMGHIRPDDDPYTFPEIQLQWLGARLVQSGEKAKLAVKAYVLPGTKARDYMNRGLARSVSWRGKVAQEPFEKGVRIKKFLIESIDLARPRAAGMSAQMVGALTSEMSNDGGNSVKPEEIGALQENELRAHAPNLVAQIEGAARKPLETRVSEMETTANDVLPLMNSIPELRKILGLGNDVEPLKVLEIAIANLKAAGKAVRESLLNSVLDKKLKGGDEAQGALLRRLVASEMRDREITVTGNETTDEQTVSEMVNEIIDGDDGLKKIASEMQGAPAAPPVSGNDRGSNDDQTRELKVGYSNSRIRVRTVSR